MKGRVAPPGDGELRDLLERLTTTGPRYDVPLFETKQKVLMFAAALGRYRRRKRPLSTRDSGAAIRFDIFESCSDDDFVYALAIDDSSDLKVLDTDHEDGVVRTFEEYAYAGLQELMSLTSRSGADALDVVLDLVQQTRSDHDVPPEGIDPDVFRDLIG